MRSVWKGIYVSKDRRTDSIVLRKYLGKRISIYNGKENKEFLIREAMLGAYLGEFILTKKLGKEIHIKSNKRKK